MKRRTKDVMLGAATGAINGVFGGGGGTFAVPMLVGLGKEQHVAQATAMALILPLSIVSGIVYAFKVGVTGSMLWTAAGSIPGAWLGARWMARIDSVWLSRAFAAFAVLAGARMLFT